MSQPRRLPAGFEPWAEALNTLTPALVGGLLPTLHGLDDLIHRRDAGSGTIGPIDGYDGLASRGAPERILMSEWLLASELPMEFLRRAAHNELLFLAPAYQRPQPRGRVVVLVDNGPDQLGAARLVQLATLIVLHRRSVTRGAGITIGVLGDDAMSWLDGDLDKLLRTWLVRRTRTQPTPASVELRHENLHAHDEVWVLAGLELSRRLGRRRRVLQISEGTWGPEGVTELHVELDGDGIELALPSRELSVRALRGSAFRNGNYLTTAQHHTQLRDPSFASQARHLLMRGEGDNDILAVAVPERRSPTGARVRLHRFRGPIVAGAYFGRRLVAVVLEEEMLRVRVVGKPIGQLDRLAHPTAALGTTPGEVKAVSAAGLPPLYFSSPGVVCRIAGTWWRLSPDICEELDCAAVAPGKNIDVPRLAVHTARGIRVDNAYLPGSADATAIALGHGGWCAVTADRVYWRPILRGQAARVIAVGGDATVLALVTDNGEPKLVTISSAGLVLRLVGASSVRTLTKWSGGSGRPAIHPILPLIAVQRSRDVIEVGDLLTGEVLQVVRSEQ